MNFLNSPTVLYMTSLLLSRVYTSHVSIERAIAESFNGYLWLVASLSPTLTYHFLVSFSFVFLFSRPVDKLSLVWRRNGVEVASGVGSFGRRLTIVNPTTADMGLYVCEASLLDSSVKSAEARAFLFIIGITLFFFFHQFLLRCNFIPEQSSV